MSTVLYAALAGLIAVAPAAAQVPTQPAPRTRKAESPKVFVAVLSGAYEVPAVQTRASGTAELELVGSRLRYRIQVDSIDDVTGAYIHIGRAGTEWPAVADLFEGLKAGPVSGLLTSGTLRAAHLHATTMGRLLRALRENDVYVTVHTRAHPGGELRGQLRGQPIVATR
jgi:hypothetical protein